MSHSECELLKWPLLIWATRFLQDINGRVLTVNKAAPRGSQPERVIRTYEPSFRMYVGNLPWQVDNARLMQLFSEHGEVVDARVVFDRETGRSRGFGFVTMSTEAELNNAIAALDGQVTCFGVLRNGIHRNCKSLMK